MPRSLRNFAFLVLCCFLLLVACGRKEPAPPTATATRSSAVEALATDPPTPSATATVPPTFTPNLKPTATIAPTSTTTPDATPTPTALLLSQAADFGEDRNPLTGELVDDPAQLERRPLAIKISNAPPQWVRPQSGLNDADLVFEHITEAGITRFTIIVYSKVPPDVGPIRSARLIDLELPLMYDAALVYSGSSEGVRQRLLNSEFRSRITSAAGPGYYRTGAAKPFEHTLYGTPATLWDVLTERGLNTRPTFRNFMAFGSDAPKGGAPANDVAIDYRWTLVEWKYDPESERYLRWADGTPHLDANTGEQVTAANVIVIIANHVEDPTICEQVTNGVCTHLSIEAQIWGSGSAIIFRDGQRYDATWHRANRYDMLTFTDSSGQPLPLQIGNSWFQVIPTWYADPVSATP